MSSVLLSLSLSIFSVAKALTSFMCEGSTTKKQFWHAQHSISEEKHNL